MEDPLNQASKKKPAFAFWDRQRKDSTASLSNSAVASTSASSSTSPSTARRLDAIDRASSSSPSPHRQQQQQQAGSSPHHGLSGVQRLIQQYSQSGASAGPSSLHSSSPTRSLSGRRRDAPSPTPSRIAPIPDSAAPPRIDEPHLNVGHADSSIPRYPSPGPQAQLVSHSAPSDQPMLASELARQPSTSASSASRSTASRSTHSFATPTSRLSLDAVAPSTSATASTSLVQEPPHDESTKQSETEKTRRRRRLLQEQVRKRHLKRRSATGIDPSHSPNPSDHDSDAFVDQDSSSSSELGAEDGTAPTATTSATLSVLPDLADGHPTDMRAASGLPPPTELNLASDSTRPKSSETVPDAQHAPHTHLVIPSKSTADNLDVSSSARNDTVRAPSLEDTRPWLEFSPLMPDDELLDSPGKPPAPTFALPHQSASSDLTPSASQSSIATDPNASGSARPSPSRSNSASVLSSDSPRSPTGLGFSTPPGYASAASYLAMNSPTSNSRGHRTTKLPPPRPSPQAPLPPPPSLASSSASSSSRHVTATAPPRSARSSSIRRVAPVASVQDELDADMFGAQSSRSRSYSLEQEVAAAGEQDHRLAQQSAAHSQHALSTKPRADEAKPSAASTLAVPMIRQRSNSLQRAERNSLELAAAEPSRSSRTSPPRSTPPIAIANSSRTGSSRSVTVGRPRGFTVGAVPGHSNVVRGSGPVPTPAKSRPRSLLSNEVFPLDLAEPRYRSKAARDDDDEKARKTYSMDIDRRVSSLSINSAAAARSSGGLGTGRGGLSSTSIEEQGGASSTSADRLVTESTDRRPSVGGRSRSGSSASLLQQVNSQPKSHASFVIAVVGHTHSGKSTVIKKGLRQFGLSKPHVLSEKVTSHSTVCVVDQEQRTIEVLEIDASVLLNGPSKRFTWPKFLPHIDAVILCYDASEIASFRGMSELLENFSVANLSTVMLACKSEVHPKAVDPYYASDMACIYNVGLAECTVQSEEGKKRMRDCFSYLVKEVAKARSGRARRGPASTVPPASASMAPQRSLSPGAPNPSSTLQSRTASNTSQTSSQNSLPRALDESSLLTSDAIVPGQSLSTASHHDLLHSRGFSDASSNPSVAAGGRDDGSTSATGTAPGIDSAALAMNKLDLNADPSTETPFNGAVAAADPGTLSNARKMSAATVASAVSDAPSFHSDENGGANDSLQRAQLGLQNARSSGGYVSIEQLWDKLFHAAISRTDERFVSMFMVFFRGFATPMDLLRQMVARYETLSAEDVASGVVHRFALIRLANMLGDWVLDYPGDLSDPDTHALLVHFHRQLLQNPDTVHTASQIRAAVDATAYAADPDALWSKAVNSYQTRHRGIAAVIAEAHAAAAGVDVDVGGALPTSHSSGSAGGFMPSSGNTSHDFDGETASGADVLEEHERTGSESSLPLQAHDMAAGGRSRSASDLTTSSSDGVDAFYKDAKQSMASSSLVGSAISSVSGHTQASSNGARSGSSPGGGAATHTSATLSTVPTAGSGGGNEANASGPGRALDQKSALRSISNVLMEVDDEIIATELTRLEWAFFTAIRPRDLLRHILVPHDRRDGPVSRSISHFNYISNWVCSMILAQSKTKHRARMLEKFFNIASILRHDNNYGSLNSVLGGLSKTAVHRLRQTRELLKGKAVNKAYQSLVRLMSNERSSAAYRLALENSDGPTIPYVGVHLQDIISISDGNPSKRASDGMIHWRKFSLMDEAVMAVAKCQQYDRYIKPNPPVERLIVDVPVMDDEGMYERSLAVEPRSGGGGGGASGAAGKIKDLKTFLQG
ncbi:guanyl-nucleotide exchange factor [Pseudozyma hubeiensis SY62]|uniref:Guanyl-nucleotide exchange factor n=1 Tax=Pseudozyma hubeiensis (strain SY62) TaxID=1305764 RepID=R9P9H1_PSEHS|nr:guanyl-nucleotide exchange factor [Pseudozyma hubeiensis SY62]GAC94735.1 guanyl-nucleotide exchange factor [Pseudozyma hubeiensis SY62]